MYMEKVMRLIVQVVSFIVLFGLIVTISNYESKFSGTAVYNILENLRISMVVLLLISMLFIFGELFLFLPFPLSLPSPVFKASGGALTIWITMEILLRFVPSVSGARVVLTYLVPLFIFVIILIGDYTKLVKENSKEEKVTLEKVKEEVAEAVDKALKEKDEKDTKKKKFIKKARK